MTEKPSFKFALREDLKGQEQFLPTRGEPTASGWDVRAAMEDRQTIVLHPFQTAKIHLGFRGIPPQGWWYELKPRSSSFAKKSLHALYGTIDETYEGELIFACQFIPPMNYTHFSKGGQSALDWSDYLMNNYLKIEFGDAIGQIIPVKRQEMEVVSVSNEDYDNEVAKRAAQRGAGGFGSTGK